MQNHNNGNKQSKNQIQSFQVWLIADIKCVTEADCNNAISNIELGLQIKNIKQVLP